MIAFGVGGKIMRAVGVGTVRGVAALAVAAAVGCLANSAGAAEPPTLVPLQTYAAGKDLTQDPGALEYILERCSGLYVADAKALERETAPERIALKKSLKDAAGRFLQGAAMAEMKGTTTPMENAFDTASAMTVKLTGAYMDIMDRARVYSGDFSQDPTLNGDTEYCKIILSVLPK